MPRRPEIIPTTDFALLRYSVNVADDIAELLNPFFDQANALIASSKPTAVITYQLRQEIASILASVRETARPKVIELTNQLLRDVSDATTGALVQAGYLRPNPDLSRVRSSVNDKYDGISWSGRAAYLVGDSSQRLTMASRNAKTIAELRKTIGQAKKNTRSRTVAVAATATSFSANLTRLRVMREAGIPEFVGWRYVAVLDSRTSAICSGLSGNEYAVNDPDIPRPPRHPNCRSILVPIIEGENPAFFKMNFEDWLRSKSVAFQRSYLGPTRYGAFKKGLPLSAFATIDRPLSNKEIKALFSHRLEF